MKKTLRVLVYALACGAIFFLASNGGERASQSRGALAPAANRTTSEISAPVAGVFIRHMSSPAGAPQSPPGPIPSQIAAHERFATALIASPAVFEPAANTASNNLSRETQFVGRATGMSVALTRDGITVRVAPAAASANPNQKPQLSIRVRGSGPLVWQGEQKAQGESNYFLGNNPNNWRTHVPRYVRVETAPGHGLGLAVYAARQSQNAASQAIEYDVRAAPGTDPAKLRLDLTGAESLKINAVGGLVMRVAGREMQMNAPAIYEQVSSTATGTHKKATSSPRSRKSTSTHSAPRGARRETAPRKNSSADTERRRVRKSMHNDPHPRRKKRPRKTLNQLPLGDDSSVRKSAPAKQQPSAQPAQSGRRIQGGYILEADGSVGIWLGPHDPKAAILIDPSLTLTYESFLGGTGADSANSMTIDSAGDVYLAGITTSGATFPEGANAIEGNDRGSKQLFLAKISFSASGTGTLQYLSFFGGSAAQSGGQVAVDPSGNAAVLGTTTSADYPVTDGNSPTPGLTGGAGNDLVVSEVDPTGANLLFSTIFGGSGIESQNAASGIALNSSQNIPAAEGGIAFDASGNIYVASDTTSQDLPTTANAYQTVFGGKRTTDGFFAEFQPQNVASGSSDLLYCSYLGTNSDQQVAVGGVAVDAASPPNVYIAGLTTNSIDGFPSQGAFQTVYGGASADAFLMKILPAGTGASDLIYATLLGGSGIDEALGVAVDTQFPANAYIVGATQSPNFPETPVVAGPSTSLYQVVPPPPPGGPATQNAFLAVVAWNPGTQMSSLQYLTYLGGSQQDAAQSVEALFANTVYIGGTATSYDFAWHDNLQPFNGAADAFVAKLDTTQSGANSLFYVTPLGGTFLTPGFSVATLGNGIAADALGHVYVAGETTASDFPSAITSSGEIDGFQQVCGSCQESPAQPDAFLAAIQEGTTPQPAVSFRSGNINFGSSGVQIGTQGVPQPFFIVNTGETPLHLSTANPPVVTGANAADFSVAVSSGAGCPQPLPPSQGCQAEVNFTPSAAGIEGGVVSIVDDAPGSPQLLEVTGKGIGTLTAVPASFAFANAPVGAANPQVISVTITAGVSVNGIVTSVSGPDSAQFRRAPQGATCPASLSAASSCTLVYEFAPTTIGTFHAELDLSYQVNGVTGLTEKLPLTGTAVSSAAVAVVRPSQLSFNTESVGTTTIAQNVLVANTGSAPLGFTQAIGISGANAADFLESDNCQPSVAAGSACAVSLKFSPQSAGAKTATLSISDNSAGSPQVITLTGAAVLPPGVRVAPSSWGFASESVGTQSAAENVTITNIGSIPLSFTQGIGISGANAADFSQTSNCNLQSGLQPNAQCTVAVVFAPIAGGLRSATLTVADSAIGSPQTVALSGTGLEANASVSPSSIAFSGQQAGTASAAQTITVASSGPGQPLTITKLSISGTNAADFSETDTCGSPVRTSCAIQVIFTPLCKNESSSRSATLTIVDNGATPSQAIALTGAATGDFCVASISASMTQTVQAGATATFPPISILSVSSFNGTINLACATAPAGPTCSFSPSSAVTISPNVPAQFELQAVTQGSSSEIAPENRPGQWPGRRMGQWTKQWTRQWITGTELRKELQKDWPKGRQGDRPNTFPTITLAAITLLWFAGRPGRKRKVRTLTRLTLAEGALAVLCICMSSCGGSGTTTATDPPPTGTYTLTVTASEGTETQTIVMQLNVTE
jgi:hypothetical protein